MDVPDKLIKAVYAMYRWGYMDRDHGETPKSEEDIKANLGKVMSGASLEQLASVQPFADKLGKKKLFHFK